MQTEEVNHEEKELSEGSRVDSVRGFFAAIKDLFKIEVLRDNLRVTHKGLFVSEALLSELLSKYQQWLGQQSEGEVHKSESKCMKRLFGSLTPTGQYLIEGKHCLKGFLSPLEIPDPQRFGLPFYLGSLSSMREYLHPSDPTLQKLADVNVGSGTEGVELRIRIGNQTVIVSNLLLRTFRELAEHSPRVVREFPELIDSLPVVAQALVHLLRKSRILSQKNPILIPIAYKASKRHDFRTVGGFIFIFQKDGRLVSIYELRGRNLYKFVRSEFAALRTRHIGAFEIFGERHKLLGRYQIAGKQSFVSPRAFLDFLEALPNSPEKRDHLLSNFTIKESFEKFSEIYQTSQVIEKHKILSYVERFRRPVGQYKINGVWIFVISRDWVIEAVVAKFAERKGGGRV